MFLRAFLFLTSLALVLGFAGGVMFFFGKDPIIFVCGFVGGVLLLAVTTALSKADLHKSDKPHYREPEVTGYED